MQLKHLTRPDVDEHQGTLLFNNEDVRTQLLPLLNEESERSCWGGTWDAFFFLFFFLERKCR